MEHLAATHTSAGTWWKPKERSKLFDGVFIKLPLTAQGKWFDKRTFQNELNISAKPLASHILIERIIVLCVRSRSVLSTPRHLAEHSFSTRKPHHSDCVWMRSSAKIPVKMQSLLFYLDEPILSWAHVCCLVPAGTVLLPFFCEAHY